MTDRISGLEGMYCEAILLCQIPLRKADRECFSTFWPVHHSDEKTVPK